MSEDYQKYYISLASEDGQINPEALVEYENTIEAFSGKVMASQRSRMGFDPGSVGGDGMSGRYGMTNEGYDIWRPAERGRFYNIKATIVHSDMCYDKHGLIRNIIDLMSDFGSQGIRLAHPNERIELFYNNWFRKVCGVERTERFLNNLYRLGNVVCRWQNARLTPTAEQRLYKTSAAELDPTIMQVKSREIPWKYTFLHPATIEVLGGPLASFVGDPQYVIKLPLSYKNMMKEPTELQARMLEKIPAEIRAAVELNKPILLPQDRTRVYHYKKDDWQEWAKPMISSILLDVSIYEKLKLADRAALDGAISNIRIFKLGSLEHKIIPGEAAAQKLASILESNVQAGTLDLIWGPDIELIESNTNVHNFLGKEKYEPTLMAIYGGLGIPPTLTGTFGAAGTTNNFISLKTLTQRLEYGRDVVTRFWNEQVRIVQEAMGFRFPATVEFDLMNLGDEAAEKTLLIQLADRNLISDEMLQRHFNHDPKLERIRINRENKKREQGKMVNKAGAFHDPQFDESLKKVFAQSGAVTPSQVGIELQPKKKGEKAALEMRQPAGPGGAAGRKPGGKKTSPNNGRPKNSKDSSTRKTKTFRPKTKAAIEVWANNAQDKIADIMNPFLLKQFAKKNMRSLTSAQTKEAERIRFSVLSNLEPFTQISEEDVYAALKSKADKKLYNQYLSFANKVTADLDRGLTVDEHKTIKSIVYAEYKGEE